MRCKRKKGSWLSSTVMGGVLSLFFASNLWGQFEVDHAPYAHVYYGVMRAELGSEMTTDFQVDFKWLMDAYGDVGYLWVMNAAGTKGYGVRWHGGTDSAGLRGGHINIVKYNSNNAYDRFREITEPWNFTTLVAGTTYLNGDSTSLPFADFVFSWDGVTHDLRLAVTDPDHGITEISVNDTSFSSFATVYMTAKSDGDSFYIDEMLVGQIVTMTCQEKIAAGLGILSDLTEDCYVGLEDMAIFAADWMRCNDPANVECEGL